jgi:hypothetical protein
LLEERGTGLPLISPYLYQGFRSVAASYMKEGKYPNMDDFRAELRKTEGRLQSLPIELQEPKEYDWVKFELQDFRHTLVWERV